MVRAGRGQGLVGGISVRLWFVFTCARARKGHVLACLGRADVIAELFEHSSICGSRLDT